MGNRTSQLLPQELRKVAHHLSAAKQAEKHVVAQRNEAKRMDPDGKMWERDDQLFNQMNALAGAITDSPEPRATPAGAVKKGAKRRVAGMVLPRERDEAPKYGLAEAELKSMLVLATADARNQDTPDVVELARNHDLDQKDVARVLHFCCPAMPVANNNLAQFVAPRSFCDMPNFVNLPSSGAS